MNQSNNPYEYFAFISYKREDEKWAKWLQKKLESYSLPTAVRNEKPELPNKIRPVFRDQSELSGGNLKAEIEKGLNGSKYLIVICSPRSAKSPWVSKEVQHFIDQGREDFIIPFIIGGTPNASIPEDECFPEGLRQLKGEKEILGININEMGRDAAAIKVIARMFGLRFDTLWQRHERAKRLRRLSMVLLSLFIVIVSIFVAVIISHQNMRLREANISIITEKKKVQSANTALMKANKNIKQQSLLLAQANDSLTLINDKLAKSNKDLTIERNNVLKASIQILNEKRRLIAYKADQMLQEGRTLEAWDLLLENSPSEIDKQDPISPEIVSVLYKIYYLLNDNEDFNCIANLENDLKDDNGHMFSGDYGPFISPDGRYNAYSKDGFFFLYDILSNKKIALEGSDFTDCSGFRYTNDGKILYGFGSEYLFGWDMDSKRMLFKKPKTDFTDGSYWDEEDWDIIEKQFCKKLSCRTYKNYEYSDFLKKMEAQYYNYGIKIPMYTLGEKGISDFQVLDDIYIIQKYVFSNRKIDHIEPILDKYCHIYDPNKKSYFELPISLQSSHKDQIIDFENYKWKLHSSNYGIELFYKQKISNDENDNQILYYSCDSILILKNHEKYIISTIPKTTIGNGSNLISEVHILNSESLFFEAAQGPHVLYNIDTFNRTIFQESLLNGDSGGYFHFKIFPIYSDLIKKDHIFYTISLGGVLSLWDINSGALIWEFALPHTNASVYSPDVYKVQCIDDKKLFITLTESENDEPIMKYSFTIPHLITFINYMRKQRLKFMYRNK